VEPARHGGVDIRYAVGQYVNDAVETDVGIVRAIYGDDKYERLVRLKQAYDPDNFFRLNAKHPPLEQNRPRFPLTHFCRLVSAELL